MKQITDNHFHFFNKFFKFLNVSDLGKKNVGREIGDDLPPVDCFS